MAGELPFEKISIPGPTLASIIQRFASSPGDVDGLLFGHVTRLPPPDLHDDDPAASGPSPSPLAATITGFFCSGCPMSFYDPLGRIDPSSLHRAIRGDQRPPNCSLVGWFYGRRRTPLCPSMREFAVSSSLSETETLTLDDTANSTDTRQESPDLFPNPRIFLLLTSSSTLNQSIHTHDYRAFVFRRKPAGGSLEARSLAVINVGPAFRGQYSSFSPESAFPWMPSRLSSDEGEGETEGRNRDRLDCRQKAVMQQRLLDASAEGFSLERLKRMVGPGPAEYTSELEDLYGKMLLKLEGLARLVEQSSVRVSEQEDRNLLLRKKVAGLD